jgi:exosortase F-associated protein
MYAQVHNKRFWLRLSIGALGIIILGAVYIFQRLSFFEVFFGKEIQVHSNLVFVFNKTLRLIINDFACFLVIVAIFQHAKYLKVAFYVFLFELLVLLPLYFVIKLSVEGDSEISSPLFSQIHRMIVNPTLMILLMVGFYYQNLTKKH